MPSPSHQLRERMPINARGRNEGFSRIATAGPRNRKPNPKAIATNNDELPAIPLSKVRGHRKQSAMSGHVHTTGRHSRRSQAKTPRAIAGSAANGRTMNGANTYAAAGG